MSKRIRNALLMPILFYSLVSCAPVVLSPLPVDLLTPSQLSPRWEKLAQANAVRGTIQQIADVDLQSAGRRNHLKIALLLQHPSLMRIESIPMIGPPDFFLSLNNRDLKIFFPGNREFYLGRPTMENLSKFLPVHLSPAYMVSILMGIPPPIDDKVIGWKETPAGENQRLDLFFDNRKVETIWLDRETDRVSGMEIHDPDGEIIHRVTYGNYRQVGESKLPETVTIASKLKNSRMVIRYSETELSAPGDESIFDIPIPKDITPILMD